MYVCMLTQSPLLTVHTRLASFTRPRHVYSSPEWTKLTTLQLYYNIYTYCIHTHIYTHICIYIYLLTACNEVWRDEFIIHVYFVYFLGSNFKGSD